METIPTRASVESVNEFITTSALFCFVSVRFGSFFCLASVPLASIGCPDFSFKERRMLVTLEFYLRRSFHEKVQGYFLVANLFVGFSSTQVQGEINRS